MSNPIKAVDVSKLRKETGCGMMDCKNALQETNGDYDAAVRLLNTRFTRKSNIPQRMDLCMEIDHLIKRDYGEQPQASQLIHKLHELTTIVTNDSQLGQLVRELFT